MKIPPGMLKLFLKSAGADRAVIDLVDKFEAMGFNAFAKRDATADDAAWAKFEGGEGKRTGFWLYAKSPTSRAAIGVFLEGVNDEILEGLGTGDGADSRALPAGAVTANT